MSLAQGNNTTTRPRIEPGSPDPESDALTTRPLRPRSHNEAHMVSTLCCRSDIAAKMPMKTKSQNCKEQNIMKTSPCNDDPPTPHFYIVNWGLQGYTLLYPRHLCRRVKCRRVYSFRLSGPFLGSLVRSFVEFASKFCVKVSQAVYISATTYQKAFIFGP